MPLNEPTTTSRAVQFESFGGPERLRLREVAVPQAGPGQIRVRVAAAGLNPMDWFMTSDPETAARFGLSLPCGFGTDYAGTVDQVGAGVDDRTAATLTIAGCTAAAALDVVKPRPGTRCSSAAPAAGSGCSPSNSPAAPAPA
ncbi:Alcohol dehydrogenase GroES-like domain-containing protein [Amycolatopsis sacchari]|uniref:Alcohol dehydrogenase GroES-like domain-containing protein n=1 Tax=Amycolatopsis sacchari TaxID=115433 RepID=A0A1I3XIB6_9PSEU|nr:Alcohol dehydrogenase GroES-like domain-containing protein [Amycolatopsis sacchari]